MGLFLMAMTSRIDLWDDLGIDLWDYLGNDLSY